LEADGTLALISDEVHHVYSRPRISEHITARASVDSISYRPQDFYHNYAVNPILGAAVVEVYPQSKTLKLEDKQILYYRKLLLATGASPAKPPIPGLTYQGSTISPSFRHAFELEQKLAGIRQAVVIGGGFIGSKLPKHLSKVGVQVTLN